MTTIPIIDVTDLYHPHQDAGDNLDILMAYSLPEVDLRAVVLDATQRFRGAYADHPNPDYRDYRGPREPGMVPMMQLNALFGRAIPFGVSCFRPMRDPADCLEDVPFLQQSAIELVLDTLRASAEPVHILSFGSTRTIAAAFNRAPDLMREKVAKIHLSAGSSGAYLEWNIMLDPHAAVCVLRSGLPVDIFPCASGEGPFEYGLNNSFWRLQDLSFIADMEPGLRRYLAYAFNSSPRLDFLRALEDEGEETADFGAGVYAKPHNVWETAIWQNVTGRLLTQTQDGWRLLPPEAIAPHARVLRDEFWPVGVEVSQDGRFTWQQTDVPTPHRLFMRRDPMQNEAALREAVPALYRSFSTKNFGNSRTS